MGVEFIPFDKAAEELGLPPDQLKKLISTGAVRAFSDGGTFKFRRQDLDAYKAKHAPGRAAPSAAPATPHRPTEEIETIEEIPELSLDEMELVEDAPAPPPPAPAVSSSAPTLSTEELRAKTPPAPPEPSRIEGGESALLEDLPGAEVLSIEGDFNVLDDTGATAATQPIELEGEGAATTEIPAGPDLGTVSMEVPDAVGSGQDEFGIPAGRAGGLEVKREGSPAWAAVVMMTTLALALAGVVFLGVLRDRPVGYLKAFNQFWVDKSSTK